MISLKGLPDSSPLASAQFPQHHESPPLVEHVHESLSGWAGHSNASSPGSSRASPGPGWATQVDMSLEGRKAGGKDNDSGVASETSSVELRGKEKFNLGEIINFVSASWNSVSRDSSVQVYPNPTDSATHSVAA